MKIYWKSPGGWEFNFDRQPMDDNKFYVLVGLTAFALLLATMLLWEVWR